MTYKLSTPENENYAATVVSLKNFVDLPNCDNVKAAIIFGNSVIVDKQTREGQIGLFFPVECQLSKEFLSNNNLYRKPEWNKDPTRLGFFEEKGRVKALKFRGHKSEGFWVPMSYLFYLNPNTMPKLEIGDVFDTIDGNKICNKYIPPFTKKEITNPSKGKQPKLEDMIVDGQFRFHLDTSNFRKNAWKLKPTDWISITDKWHGTSVVFANILVNKKLNWFEKLLIKLKVNIVTSKYGFTYSTRRVIKEVDGSSKNSLNFYTTDVHKDASQNILSVIPEGYTIYAEIVGYQSNGSHIQKGYHYGCKAGLPIDSSSIYYFGENKVVVYRVTSTNAKGKTLELSWPQVQEFCAKYGLSTVPTFWYGQAKDLFPDLNLEEHWNEEFLTRLEKTYVTDQMCPYNNNKVPAEGIVLRIDRLEECESFKLKNFKFLEWETKQNDEGTVDLETMESIS